MFLSISLICDRHNNPVYSVPFILDITQQKQAKEVAETTSRSKSIFLASISHELRTSLNAILGFAQLLAQDSNIPPNQRQQYFRTTPTASSRISRPSTALS